MLRVRTDTKRIICNICKYNPYNYEQTLQNMMPSAVNVNVQPDYQLSVQTTATPSEREKTTDTFSEKPEEADARLRRMLNKIIDNVNQMNAYKESLYQPYNNTYGDTSLPMQTTDYTVSNGSFGNQVNYNLPNSMQDNSSTWDNMYNYACNTVNTIAPYIPTYYLGYGIGTAQNMIPQINNTLSDVYNIYKNNGVYAIGEKYAEPSVRDALQAKKDIELLKISDVNKHQYVSCVGSTDGLLAATETLAGGAYKEIKDTYDKLRDSKKRKNMEVYQA